MSGQNSMGMSEKFYYEAPWARLIITIEDDQLSGIEFLSAETESSLNHRKHIFNKGQTAQKVCKQLDEYFSGSRRVFDLPLRLRGTGFQKEVWEVLQQIPYGEVLSYGQVAKTIGRPQAQRAVGMACNRNPVPIVVPCHRVLGTNGRLTGYAGGLDIKVRLLELEKKNSK